jgi:hypothetical protein
LNSLQQLRIDSKDARSQYIASIFLLLVACMISFLVAIPLFLSLAVITMVASKDAKPIAVSLPMPDVAPVIKTILFFKQLTSTDF